MIAYLAHNRVVAPRAVAVATQAAPSTDGIRDPVFSYIYLYDCLLSTQ
jgi:hypothetical protein